MTTVIPEKLLQVLKHEGVVAIATQGEEGPHLVNTWNRVPSKSKFSTIYRFSTLH